jgi:hypothetical protein
MSELQSVDRSNQPPSAISKTPATSSEIQRPAIPVLQKAPDTLTQKNELADETLPVTPAPLIQTKERAPLQLKTNAVTGPFKPVQRKQNQTGLPDNLKTGVENLSGTNLSDVKVHYASSQPAQFNAYAYAQGSDIHIAPGQEQHLPHEAWHVAQQKQGRVQATTQMKGAGINDDMSLEKEADDMGAKAMSLPADSLASGYEHFNKSDIGQVKAHTSLASTAQRQAFENINSEINASLHSLHTGNNSSVQRHAVKQLVAGKFLVDDGLPLGDGQIHKSSFLANLRAEVKAIAKEIMEPVGLAQDNCPDLNYWIGYYGAKDAAYFESAIAKYAPATQEAADMGEYLAGLTGKVRDALTKHVATGNNEFDPEEVPKEIMEKRPDIDWLPMQMKAAPIQFGCGNTGETTAEPKKTGASRDPVARDTPVSVGTGTGAGRPAMIAATGTATRAEYKAPAHAEVKRARGPVPTLSPGALRAKIVEIERKPEPDRCQGLIALFRETYQDTNDLDTPIAFRPCGVRREAKEEHLKTDEERRQEGEELAARNFNYGAISSCGGTQFMVMAKIFGADGLAIVDLFEGSAVHHIHQRTGGSNERYVNVLGLGQVSDFITQFSSSGIAAMFSGLGTGGQGHCFTLIKDHHPETKELVYHLYQGWAKKHNVLDPMYTREFNGDQLRTFLTAITTSSAHPYFIADTKSTEFKYEIR